MNKKFILFYCLSQNIFIHEPLENKKNRKSLEGYGPFHAHIKQQTQHLQQQNQYPFSLFQHKKENLSSMILFVEVQYPDRVL